ncbi:MarR family winged helix-turn-helix transcriptional regulator [Athalassotoga saccharophila]|uniref:MarR family winged helix-turn-helix transcriptional regulator n=1 Tax=Athalassotoga saccharophila TaxID=1441386 RepID=UPI001379D3FC|nr:winged helix DNA-binding protein [Athalassotoga saccharophila]BBJ27564.1 transcriptional repressor MprA [Athalassotoga saccharophila]
MKREVPEDLLMAYSSFSKIVFKSFDYSKTKLPKTSASILIFMRRHSQNRAQMSEIENKYGFVKSTITAATDVLVREGYVKRYRTDEDRRAVFIELTERGMEKAAEIEKAMREYVNEKLSVLSDEQFEKLLNAFSIIKETVEILKNF